MSRISVKMPNTYRYFLFTVFAISWVTGIAFFIFSNWITVEGDFGPEKHPLQYPILQLHGASAFFMMMLFGALLAAHMPVSWRLNRMRNIGLTLVTLVSVQVITAYFLYYLSNESIREVISYIHLAAGGCLPFVLFTHIAVGIRTRRTNQSKLKPISASLKTTDKPAKAA